MASELVVDATGNNLTYRVIGAAMTVHNQIGSGFKEEVYEKALEVELNRQAISLQRQYPVPVEYQAEPVALFYQDLSVPNQISFRILFEYS